MAEPGEASAGCGTEWSHLGYRMAAVPDGQRPSVGVDVRQAAEVRTPCAEEG